MGRSSKKPEKSRKNGTKRILVRPQSSPPRSAVQQALNFIKMAQKAREIKGLRLEGSNFRLGGIAPITRAVPSFRFPMRLAVSVV